MNAQDAIVDTYEDLINCYTSEHSCAFLRACWFLNEEDTLQAKSLSRMIFSDGNSKEIYTKHERAFIAYVMTEVDYHCFQMSSKRGPIDCRIVSVDFCFSSNTLYDGIEFMKIFNKAFDGFNIFLFVCFKGVHLGCSYIKRSEKDQDCVISPLMIPEINWELVYNTLLFRNASSDFYDYYSGMVGAILEIKNCFVFQSEEGYVTSFYDYDDDMLEDTRRIQLADFLDYKYIEPQPNNVFDREKFESDMQWCFDEFDFIKSSRINTLEMLFEAEKALEQSNTVKQHNGNDSDPALPVAHSQDNNENFELLDDVVELMKKLKKERGL